MKMRRVLLAAGVLLGVPVAGFAGYIAWLGIDSGRPSVCRGNLVNGSLELGRRLPYSGENYRAYSIAGFLFGRTFVHSSVRDAMRDAYAELRQSDPDLRFIYAETGWPWGGRFAPHRSHSNGTSVDFHVPVRTLDGKISELPTSPFTGFGYLVRFDPSGKSKSGTLMLDFEAMGKHLLALDKAARSRGIRIRRVIFNVGLQPKLRESKSGAQAMSRLAFNARDAWVPHDEHYHVDFDVPCR